MKRTGRLVVGFAVAGLTVAALAAPSLAGDKASTASITTSISILPASCSYPPVTSPTITLSASPGSVPAKQRFALSGTVKINSCGLPLRIIGLYRASSPNGAFVLDETGITGINGAFSFSATLTQTSYYKVVSAAGLGYNSASSSVVTVTRR